jgi:dTDP-4-dehydrorhamnose 3,5-epimerase
MEVIKTTIPGCYEIQPRIFEDSRGKLIKTFHHDTFLEHNFAVDFKEEYYSVSKKGVLRGLHFQIPPFDHVKCITCMEGFIFDVVVDLRKGSPAFGQYQAFEVSALKGNMVYIPTGCAHGFVVLSETAIFLNRTTTVFNISHDAGIKWDSCGISWPFSDPILSDKDKSLPGLKDYDSPFRF